MNIIPYQRKAQYYETDQMGIIHHANYIHWFEEARVDFMDQIGFTYQRMEREGLTSPLLGVACDYKSMVRFGDTVLIEARITAFNGVKMTVSYRVLDAGGQTLRALGKTEHCFMNASGRLVSLQKANPDLYALFLDATSPDVE